MKTISDLYAAPGDIAKWLETIPAPLGSSPNWKPLYFIAITARSGSTMLCSMMEKVGDFGIPDEYLNPRGPFTMYHSKFGGQNIQEYLENIQNRLKSDVLGIKTAFLDFYPFAALFAQIPPKYANFIYLTRLDVFSQAVSLWSAKKTHLWHSTTGTKSKIEIGDYNYSEIFYTLLQIIEERVKWEIYFSINGIVPLRLNYEDICNNHIKAISSIAVFLGIEISEEFINEIKPTTTILSTENQKLICNKFSEEFISKNDLLKVNEMILIQKCN